MISVIIPIWNSGTVLDECLSSLVSQTEKDWECLLIDDGSEDNSFQICSHWSEFDRRFKVFQQDHLGVSAARNRGIQESAGDYLVFVDSDDTMAPTCLENLISPLPADLVIGGYCRCFPDSNEEDAHFLPVSRVTFKITPKHEAVFADLNDKFLLYSSWAKLFNANIIKHNRIQFPENRSLGEDLEFNYQYLNFVDSLSCITDCIYFYHIRKNNESLSSKRRPGQFYSDLEQWRIIKSFSETHGVIQKEMAIVLAKRLWEIVYDSLLLHCPSMRYGFSYFRDVLSIPEISYLTKYKSVYPGPRWIKALMIHRVALFFYIYDRFSQ